MGKQYYKVSTLKAMAQYTEKKEKTKNCEKCSSLNEDAIETAGRNKCGMWGFTPNAEKGHCCEFSYSYGWDNSYQRSTHFYNGK